MAVRFVLPPDPTDAVTTAYSPLTETALSLRVLAYPHKHPLKHAWVRRMRRLDPRLLRRVRGFGFAFRCGIPDALFPAGICAAPSFADELARLEPTVMADQLDEMLELCGGLERDDGGHWADSVRLLTEDREQAAAELLALLEDYWNVSFADDWERIEPVLARTNGQLEAELRRGFYPAVAGLQHRVSGDVDTSSIAVDIRAERTLAAGADQPLVLTPSTFLWPSVMVKFEPPGPFGFAYPVPESARLAACEGADPALLKVAKALADDTRLRALKLLAREPRTTQELAPLLGLTESGLSKHLKVLAEAGLVQTRRQSYYVLYSVVPSRIATLSNALLEFIHGHEPGFSSGESVAARGAE